MSQAECNISNPRESPWDILYDAIWIRLRVLPEVKK